MSDTHQLTACPSCSEPLDSGDRYCGACGHDLSAAVEPPPGNGPDGTPPAAVEWPMAADGGEGPRGPAPVHRPADLPGVDSGGTVLPTDPPQGPQAPPRAAAAPAAPAAAPVPAARAPQAPPAVRLDGPPAGDPEGYSPTQENPRPADPRTAAPPEPAGKVCVACRTGYVDTDGYCERCGHAQPRERDHMERELDAVSAVSDRGLRHHRNEDAFAISATALPDGSSAVCAVVCDGVSSATRPDEASMAASRAANESLLAALPLGTHPQTALHEAIVAAADAVNALAARPAEPGARARDHAPHQNAPACTIVASVVAGGLLAVGWIGDSRAYWVPDDRTGLAARLTEDDSWAAQMVAAGLMGEAQAYADDRAHAITGWLGADAYEIDPHTASFKPDRPGVVVVCTDGLWNYAESADEMAAVLPPDASERPLHAAQVLVGHALDGGGHDNVTVAVLPFPLSP
ncbi:protein phosphatase 2C domain-containing protein [Streptomyces sp. NPDC060194]|uniref:protein phosphatase 2C domain-containing protein n=1 Tax=Streptomyces sp. NPDC060194 TaxID=3347069 RepID=UPI003667565F